MITSLQHTPFYKIKVLPILDWTLGSVMTFKTFPTYNWGLLAKFTPERHFHCVLVSRSLVKCLALLERRAVQVQAGSAFRVTDVFYPVQADGICNT